MGQLTFILGGARSGKSTFAENKAKKLGGRVVYIATAEAKDEEMAARIEVHKRERPSHWQTVEIPINVGQTVTSQQIDADIILLDCLTLLITNVLMAVNQDPDVIDERASNTAVLAEVEELVTAVAAGNAHWIIVSNEVGLGLVPPYPLGRIYRDALGRANQLIARAADRVYFMIAGIPMHLLPEES